MATATLPTTLRPRVLAPTVRAPQRFDTHQVDHVGDQIGRALVHGTDCVVVDGSDVAFVDQDAVDLLVSTDAGSGRRVRLDRPSLALQITMELLGHQPAVTLERAA